MRLFAKMTLIAGSGLVFFAIAGASVITYPTYAAYYYSAATGLTLILAGLISLI